jgi:hypothetical protein
VNSIEAKVDWATDFVAPSGIGIGKPRLHNEVGELTHVGTHLGLSLGVVRAMQSKRRISGEW